MEKFRYYYNKQNELLLAIDNEYDFITMFVFNKNEWKFSDFSFMRLSQDFDLNEISKENVLKLTNNKLPTNLYEQFIKIIENNRKG